MTDAIRGSAWRPVAAYAAGVWGGLTIWAALAQYVLPGRGQALGKLGSFHWVFLINALPALLCAAGFAAGLAISRRSASPRPWRSRLALCLGMVFPLSIRVLRPVLDRLGAGMMPALVWCVVGSAGAAWLLARWGRRAPDGAR